MVSWRPSLLFPTGTYISTGAHESSPRMRNPPHLLFSPLLLHSLFFRLRESRRPRAYSRNCLKSGQDPVDPRGPCQRLHLLHLPSRRRSWPSLLQSRRPPLHSLGSSPPDFPSRRHWPARQ